LEYAFPDQYNGYASSEMAIHVTHDGGLSWTPQPIQGDIGSSLSRLTMLDPFHGYVAMTWNLLETHDGWQTYTIHPNYTLIQGNYYKKVYQLSADTLLMHCEHPNNSDRLMRSVDRGLSWTLTDFVFDRVADFVCPTPGVVLAGGGFGVGGA